MSTAVGGGPLLEFDVVERFIVLREKSCGGRAFSARHLHTIGNGPPTVGKVWRRLGVGGVLMVFLFLIGSWDGIALGRIAHSLAAQFLAWREVDVQACMIERIVRV